MTLEEASPRIVSRINEDADCCEEPIVDVFVCEELDGDKVILENEEEGKRIEMETDYDYYVSYTCDNCSEMGREIYKINRGIIRKFYCTNCNGSGMTTNIVGDFTECTECDGTGWIWNQKIGNFKRKYYIELSEKLGCERCEWGKVYDMYYVPEGPDDDGGVHECEKCNSRGFTFRSVLDGIRTLVKSYIS